MNSLKGARRSSAALLAVLAVMAAGYWISGRMRSRRSPQVR